MCRPFQDSLVSIKVSIVFTWKDDSKFMKSCHFWNRCSRKDSVYYQGDTAISWPFSAEQKEARKSSTMQAFITDYKSQRFSAEFLLHRVFHGEDADINSEFIPCFICNTCTPPFSFIYPISHGSIYMYLYMVAVFWLKACRLRSEISVNVIKQCLTLSVTWLLVADGVV